MKNNNKNSNGNNGSINEDQNTSDVAMKKVKLLKKQVEELEAEVDDLVEKNKVLRAENKELKAEQEKIIQQPNPASITTVPKEASIPKFYAFSPDGTNGFTAKGLFQDSKENHIFIISLLNENTAEFEVTKEKEMQIYAAKTANTMLQPVCAFENLPREMESGIQTVEKGQLLLQGNEWVVRKEARIRFV